ncbi:hypothetical protein [Streptomyces sp. NPDC001568]|uniref:hypothetical protein n=1 Tax=Streptomyces sp. NPDC001568 TaxID=3364588 RepID=UPI0036BFC109
MCWTSLPHVQALEAWADQWGWGSAGRRAMTAEALDERAHLAGQAVTTGQIIRTALESRLHGRP